jgi:hypothetical protein
LTLKMIHGCGTNKPNLMGGQPHSYSHIWCSEKGMATVIDGIYYYWDERFTPDNGPGPLGVPYVEGKSIGHKLKCSWNYMPLPGGIPNIFISNGDGSFTQFGDSDE